MVAVPPLRVVFFGTPAFAVPTLQALIESRHAVVAVVSQPDRPKGRGHHVEATPTKALAIQHGIPVLQPTKLRDQAFLGHAKIRRGLAVDGVVVGIARDIGGAERGQRLEHFR